MAKQLVVKAVTGNLVGATGVLYDVNGNEYAAPSTNNDELIFNDYGYPLGFNRITLALATSTLLVTVLLRDTVTEQSLFYGEYPVVGNSADISVIGSFTDTITITPPTQTTPPPIQTTTTTPPSTTTPTPTNGISAADKLRAQSLNFKLRNNQYITDDESVFLQLGDSALATRAMAALDNGGGFDGLRALGISEVTSYKILAIFNIKLDTRKYESERALELIANNPAQLVNLQSYLTAQGITMPSLTSYIATLRADNAIYNAVRTWAVQNGQVA